MLVNITNGGSQLRDVVILLGDRWYDLNALSELASLPETEQEAQPTEMRETMAAYALQELMQLVMGELSLMNSTGSGGVEQLPTAGLEDVKLAA